MQKQFEIVSEIVRCGSISKAAKSLGIAQPTLSKYLSNLEDKLGVELFDRTKLPISLTEAGEKYIKAGNRILDIYSQLEKDFSRIKNEERDVLRIGISPTRAHYIISTLTEEFRKINSSAKIVVRERTTSQLNADLVRGEIDLAVSLKYDGTRDFAFEELFSEKIVLAIPKKYEEIDTMKILKECPFISIGEGLRMAEILLNILREVGGAEPSISVQSIDSALSLANRGMGAVLAPSYISEYGVFANLVFRELPDEVKKHFGGALERNVCVFFTKGRELTSVEKDFINACKTIVKK